MNINIVKNAFLYILNNYKDKISKSTIVIPVIQVVLINFSVYYSSWFSFEQNPIYKIILFIPKQLAKIISFSARHWNIERLDLIKPKLIIQLPISTFP